MRLSTLIIRIAYELPHRPNIPEGLSSRIKKQFDCHCGRVYNIMIAGKFAL